MFPRVRTLIVKPSNYYSLGKIATVTLGGGFDPLNYPPDALTDGSAGKAAFRFVGGTGSVRLNLNSGNTKTPNLVGVFGHTFDVERVVNIQASTSSTMSPLLLNVGVRVADPAFWLDLRGFSVTCDYWQLTFVGNTVPVTIGEFAVAYGDEYEGIIGLPLSEDIFAPQERAELEGGAITLSASGSILRTATLDLELREDQQIALSAVFAETGAGFLQGTRVIVVPSSHRNDIWLVEWPSVRDLEFPQSQLVATMQLPLVEEAYGVYVPSLAYVTIGPAPGPGVGPPPPAPPPGTPSTAYASSSEPASSGDTGA